MKRIIHFAPYLLATLSYTIYVLPLTVNSTLMTNKASGKSVLLLGEMHTQYTKQTLSAKEKTVYDAVEQEQKSSFATLANTMLSLDPKKGTQTLIITETNPSVLGSLLEQEADLVHSTSQSDETLQVMPRIFLRHLLAPVKTSDEKITLFQASVAPFRDIPANNSFVFGGMRWIAGDSARTEQDKFLSNTIYQHWSSILESLKKKEDMPDGLSSLTIGHVKNYLKTWHDSLTYHGIDDPYANKIATMIDNVVKVDNLSTSDHIAAVHAYLRQHGEITASDKLNNNFIKFISLKADLEISMYIKAFEKDPLLKYLIVQFGSEHTQKAKELLRKDGYGVAAQIGCNFSEPKTLKDIKKQTIKALNFLKKHPDVVTGSVCGLENT